VLTTRDLSYRTSKDVLNSHIGTIDVEGATVSDISTLNGRSCVFTLTPSAGGSMQFSARTEGDARSWIAALTNPGGAPVSSGDQEDLGEESAAGKNEGPTTPMPTFHAVSQGVAVTISPSASNVYGSSSPASGGAAAPASPSNGNGAAAASPNSGGNGIPQTPGGSRALTYVSPLSMLISTQADTAAYKLACRHKGPQRFEKSWKLKLINANLKSSREYQVCLMAPARQLYLFNSERELTVYNATGKRTFSQVIELNGGIVMQQPSYAWVGTSPPASAVPIVEVLLPAGVHYFTADAAEDLEQLTRALHDMALLPAKTSDRAVMIKGETHCATVLGKHGWLDLKVNKKKFRRAFYRTLENARGTQLIAEYASPTAIHPEMFMFLLWSSGEGPCKVLRGLPPGDAWAASNPEDEKRCFTVMAGAVRMTLRAETEAERDEWVAVILSIACDDFMTTPLGASSGVDYYGVLGVPPNATAGDIGNAFRQLAKLVHPDRNPTPEALAHFQRLNEAYEVLSDPAQRETYNGHHAAMVARKLALAGAGSGAGGLRDGLPVIQKKRPNRMPMVAPNSIFVPASLEQTLISHEKLQALMTKHQKQAKKLGNESADFVLPSIANVRLAGSDVGLDYDDEGHENNAELEAKRAEAEREAEEAARKAKAEAQARREAEERRLRAEEEAKEAARRKRVEEERQRRIVKEREEAERRRREEDERLRRLAMDPIDRPLSNDLLTQLERLGKGVTAVRVPDSSFSKPSELSLRLERAKLPTDAPVVLYTVAYTSSKDKVDRRVFVLPECTFSKALPPKTKLPKELSGREEFVLYVAPDAKKEFGPKASVFVFANGEARDAFYDAIQGVLTSMLATAEKRPTAVNMRKYVDM